MRLNDATITIGTTTAGNATGIVLNPCDNTSYPAGDAMTKPTKLTPWAGSVEFEAPPYQPSVHVYGALTYGLGPIQWFPPTLPAPAAKESARPRRPRRARAKDLLLPPAGQRHITLE